MVELGGQHRAFLSTAVLEAFASSPLFSGKF